MHKIIEKTYDLLDTLDSSDLIKDLTYYKNLISKDSKILNLISDSKNKTDYELVNIKKQLLENKNYKGYLDNYNKLFYLVFEINNRYNKILNTKRCHI